MPQTTNPTCITLKSRALAAARFYALAEVPPELEWFTNIRNECTQKAYKEDIQDFMHFIGIDRPEDFRLVSCVRVIAWHDGFKDRELSPPTIRCKLSGMRTCRRGFMINGGCGRRRPDDSGRRLTTPHHVDTQNSREHQVGEGGCACPPRKF
jgi:hypothetical protein